jgi:hypothetical protein
MLAVLHTWTRDLRYHPHVHLLVTAGGLTDDGLWLATRHPAYLVPQRALAILFRAKLGAGLKRAGLLAQVPRTVWQHAWVVHCKYAGAGHEALAYLARYVFRVALSNSRLAQVADGQVTFRYRDNRTQQLRHLTLSADEFIRRFLLHTLPRSFAKVRYYGLFSPAARPHLALARTQLHANDTPLPAALVTQSVSTDSCSLPAPADPALCPFCKLGQLLIVRCLQPLPKVPP